MEEGKVCYTKRRLWEDVGDREPLCQYFWNTFKSHWEVSSLTLLACFNLLIKTCRRRDHTHNDNFARHMIQTGTDSKVLKQNNDILKQLENGLSGLRSGLTGQEAQIKLNIHYMKAGQQAAEETLNDLAGMSTRQYETIMQKLARIQK